MKRTRLFLLSIFYFFILLTSVYGVGCDCLMDKTEVSDDAGTTGGSESDAGDGVEGSENDITSEFSCKTDSDCVFTLGNNTPTNTSECVCDDLCGIGELVNLTEKTARENANTTFCGDFSCPVAMCSEGACYETACRDNLCVANEISCD